MVREAAVGGSVEVAARAPAGVGARVGEVRVERPELRDRDRSVPVVTPVPAVHVAPPSPLRKMPCDVATISGRFGTALVDLAGGDR